jgi:predicted nuclease of predicted toxin-antitoxin system
MMRFLADANIPRVLVERLREAGHDVFWAWSAPPRTSDEELITMASREKRVVITYDKGFGDLVFRQRHTTGVILLRLREISVEDTVALVTSVLSARNDWNEHFTVIEQERVRITPLPR